MSNFDLVIQLFLQLTVILAICRIVTILGRRYLGKTDVVCEEFLTTSFLLPIFFVFSGLNTQIGLVNTPTLWGITFLIIAMPTAVNYATLGKGVACMLAAKLAGESWRESATIGALMSARGLMELIILNIGLEQGVITPTLFIIMVIMAVITTLMASPLIAFLLQGTSYEKYSP
jgi:Kef-type K+ transport system membrane component KefB